MYGWMIIHFHINGYSQLYSRYCRHRKNISYRQFYDSLFELLPTSGFQDHYNRLRQVVDHYLHTGQMLQFDSFTKGQNGHGIHALSYGFMYENRFKAYELAKTVAESFCQLEPGIDLLQDNFIFGSEQQYPVTAQIDFDLSTWQDGSNCYEIRPKTTTKQFDLYQFRRQGLLKNKITKMIQQ
jgi:hypothetical protein